MYRQLYDWFRAAIIGGQLRPGQRAPSTRGLAAELKISRIPVLSAYEQLLAEGYFETFVGVGTCVARSVPDDTLIPAAAKVRSGLQEIIKDRAPRHRVRHFGQSKEWRTKGMYASVRRSGSAHQSTYWPGAIFDKAPDRCSIAAMFLGKVTLNAGGRPVCTVEEPAEQ